jgi:hemolysin III
MTEQTPSGTVESLKAKKRDIKLRAEHDIQEIKQRRLQELSAIDLHAARLLEKLRRRELEREMPKPPKRYSTGEEIFNSITHGIGAGLAIAALQAPVPGKGFYVTGFTIFGASLILLYLMSTLYHALTPYGVKKVFAVFDHSSIYLLIAGTYTPYCLTVLRGSMGWTLFGIIWVLAIAGVTFYAVFGSKMRVLSAITYVLMGWLIIFAFKPMRAALSQESIVFLLAGGAAYTAGVVFYSLKKIKWTHSIWHLFVLAGSVLHFFSVYYII